MGLLIEEVLAGLYSARMKAFRDAKNAQTSFHVYMTVDFYRDAMKEINGPVSFSVMEFYNGRTIGGCPVFLVVESVGGQRHAPWRIVRIRDHFSAESQSTGADQ